MGGGEFQFKVQTHSRKNPIYIYLNSKQRYIDELAMT